MELDSKSQKNVYQANSSIHLQEQTHGITLNMILHITIRNNPFSIYPWILYSYYNFVMSTVLPTPVP